MAVDSKAKRFSMMNFGEGDLLLPDPDGTIGQIDRAHLLGLYGWLLSVSPVYPLRRSTLDTSLTVGRPAVDSSAAVGRVAVEAGSPFARSTQDSDLPVVRREA